jgi:hypothetical protein
MHSHLAVRHLIRELELRGRRQPSVTPPAWLVTFLEETSDLFEPFAGTARAGYECTRTEEGWEAALFLGANEVVGGAQDGRVRPINFQFDLRALTSRFERVDSLTWNAFPEPYTDEEGDLSFLSAVGLVNGQLVRIQVHACAPDEAGPAMRVFTDGRCELI